MPSFDLYKKLNSSNTIGKEHKLQSDMIMEATWDSDISSRIGYFYDYYHDSEPLLLDNLHPTEDPLKVPIEIKFLQNASQTMDKDEVTFHIQFKPSHKCTIPYYNKCYKERYDAHYPVGLYVDIEDSDGIYNRWLVVDTANFNVTQFPTYEVLRCDKLIQYVVDGKKWQVPGVLRSQNSYNSGVWRDLRVETIEDQQKFILPLNRDTERIYYNQRFIIDGKILTEPRAWRLTKVNRVSPPGILAATLAQDHFDQHKDYIEIDKQTGNVIGMYADYYSSTVEPEDTKQPTVVSSIHSKITYAGLKAEIKIGGSYKKFTVNFYDNETPIDFQQGNWKFYWKENEDSPLQDATDLVTLLTSNDSNDVDGNQIKVKFNGDNTYIDKILVVEYVSNEDVTSSIDIEIVSL